MRMHSSTRIGLLVLVCVLAACGMTAAPDRFVIKPPGKISLGITFEFSGIAARQPRISPIHARIRLADIPRATFAPMTFVATGAVSLTQPLNQSVNTMQMQTIEIPVTVWINGEGEGAVTVSILLSDPRNTAGMFEKDEVAGASGTLYFYATTERLYAGIGSTLPLKRADLQDQYDQGRITRAEYDHEMRMLTTDIISTTAVPLTPTGR
jgi:hypothetical protein